MKKYCLTIILMLSIFLVYSQSPVYPLYNLGIVPDDYTDVYFKDYGNDLDKYEGIWVWEENGKKLTVTLEKKIQYYLYDSWYEDIIVGNYKYVDNGVTIIDTMTNPTNYPILNDDIYTIEVTAGNKRPNLTYLGGSYVDPVLSYHASYRLQIFYLSAGDAATNTPATIRWGASSLGLDMQPPGQHRDLSLSAAVRVPRIVTLTKQ